MAGRNIVLCADGTGNAFDGNLSNVARLVHALALDSPATQIVFYDQGVGTRSRSFCAAEQFRTSGKRVALTNLAPPRTVFGPLRLLERLAGLGFGFGLQANIQQLYTALSTEHHSADDRVFLFGFSRGAFTVRALAALVHRIGLLPVEHLSQFNHAYATFFEEQHEERMTTRVRHEFTKALKTFRNNHGSRPCEIHFLGIWDTVKSYGFIYPKSLPHLRHNPSVRTVRHALALHERRSYYQPTSWGGVDHPFYSDHRDGDRPDVREVWFAGSHSDVGGGYPGDRNGLTRAPFEWMVEAARGYGLCVRESLLDEQVGGFSASQGINESLHGWWWLAELMPRFELENIPFPGERVLKWGSTGQRHPEAMARAGRIDVHPSAIEAMAEAGLVRR